MALVPYQPALALQCTKHGAPGSTSAQACTRKRLEAEDKGAQAKRDFAGKGTSVAWLRGEASGTPTSFGPAWAEVEAVLVRGGALVSLSVTEACGVSAAVGIAADATDSAGGAITSAAVPIGFC